MRAVGLIAINFVREQRWPILVLMIWVVLLAILGLVLDLERSRNDVLFIFKQLALDPLNLNHRSKLVPLKNNTN